MAQVDEDKQNILPELFESYHAINQTARLTVNYPDSTGVFFFQNGELIEAQLGDQSGAEAVDQALHLNEDDFRIDLDIEVPPRTIFETLEDILIDVPTRQTVRSENDLDSPQVGLAHAETGEMIRAEADDSQRQAQNDHEKLILNGRVTNMEATARQVEESKMNTSVNPHTSPVAPPPELNMGEERDEISHGLAAIGMVKAGVVIDEDGIVIEEIGEQDASLAQTAFMIAGLELLVAAQFDLGPCEGAMLEKDGNSRLVTKAGGLTCAFIPAPRVPVAKAFNETRVALEKLAGERA